MNPTTAFSAYRPLRVWPAITLLVLTVAARYLFRLFTDVSPMAGFISFLAGAVGGLLILIWWLSASRATWKERLAGAGGVVIALVVVALLSESTMRVAGTMFLTIPLGMAGFTIGATLSRNHLAFRRTGVALLVAIAAMLPSLFLRTSGMSGDGLMNFHWRWSASPEERLMAKRLGESPTESPKIDFSEIEQALAGPDWPGFRGSDRTGIYRGAAIDPNWEQNPPELLWRIPVGPGWSSFAVAGDFLFTQEQRGPNEAVVCYHADDGRELWSTEIESRFEEALGGPGPRATPTLADGGIFALGAEGWLMRLDPQTGSENWRQDLRAIAEREPPTWGFSSSPLVTQGSVIVHAGGGGEKGVLAFDIDTGELRWSAASGDHSYSSPQPATMAGEELILMPTNRGLDLLAPSTGALQLVYEWPINGYRALQVQFTGNDSLILPTDVSAGTRRIRFEKAGDQLIAEDLWTSRKLKPDFNDFVIFGGNAYGFDGSVFTCLDLATGDRQWKGGRYGKGQVLLLEKSGLLLVAGEQGEAVLLEATPEAHVEVAIFQALDGKTWNHPVVTGDRLFLRNAQEAAGFRLKLATPPR